MLIAAQGDSWFDYPGADVLSVLENCHGYQVVSCAHHGDTLEEMAYAETHSRKLVRMFSVMKCPDAVLVSAGGNDMAGDELVMLLNHASSPLPAINADVLRGAMTRLDAAYRSLLFGITGLCRHYFGGATVPILIHGYGHPVPDGRGLYGGGGILPGPWLRPALTGKGHGDVARGAGIMGELIDTFYEMLFRVAGAPGLEHVRCLDLRSLLATSPGQHRHIWADELHPTEAGFGLVAQAIHCALTVEAA